MVKYDRQRFDIKLNTKRLQIIHYATCRFEGFYGLGKAVNVAHDGITQLLSSAVVNNAARTAHTEIASFKGDYKLQRNIKTSHCDTALFGEFYHLNKNCEIKQSDESAVKCTCALNKNIYHKAQNYSKLLSAYSPSKNCYLLHNDSTIFLGAYTIEKIKEEILTFNLDIPPGGELRIDGENFTVLLCQENALHLFEGDFAVLNKDIVTIEIETLNRVALIGEIFYKERYL